MVADTPCEQNDSQTGVKTLPCRNFVEGGKKIFCVAILIIFSLNTNHDETPAGYLKPYHRIFILRKILQKLDLIF